MKEDALEGLKDPSSHRFSPAQKAALLFADAMTKDGGRVPDTVFDDLRRHFGEPEIVELACVIGLFNYFNRFNNALHVAITLADPDHLARRIEEVVAQEGAAVLRCDRVVSLLHEGRRHLFTGVYKKEGDSLDLVASRGEEEPDAASKTAGPAASAVLRVEILAGKREVGVLEARTGVPDGFDEEERPLLERVAASLAPIILIQVSGSVPGAPFPPRG